MKDYIQKHKLDMFYNISFNFNHCSWVLHAKIVFYTFLITYNLELTLWDMKRDTGIYSVVICGS
jgi:hypothetical protein